MDNSEDSLLTRNQIPIIDLSHISTIAAGGTSPTCCMTMKKIACQLERCLSGKGLALLVNHGIPQHKLSLVYREMEKFRKACSIDNETYQSCSDEIIPHLQPNHSSHAFGHFSDCYKEEYHSLDIRWMDEKLPENEGQQLRNVLNSLSEEFRRVSVIMLYALAMVFGDLDTNFFVNVHNQPADGKSRNNNNNLQVLYSLRQGRENSVPDTVRFPKTEDLTTFQLIAQDPDCNLEVSLPPNKWVPVGHLPGAILFHAGKHLENWTNGKYKFLPYRIMTPEETLLQMRSGYVTLFNVQPESNAIVDPLVLHLSQMPETSSQTKHNHKRYMALFTAVQHFQRRVKLTKLCKILHVHGGTRY